jgi:hypothetical protein
MSGPKVQVGQLRLRVSGLTRDQGKRLGRLVAEHLAQSGTATTGPRSIPSIRLQVRRSPSLEGMAEDIAAGIRRTLK